MIIFICLGIFIYFYTKDSVYYFLKYVSDSYVSIDKYYVYGTHLNISGKSPISLNNPSLVFKSVDDEINFDINYDNGIFSISDFINDGIYLDALPVGTYLVFLKDNDVYYSLINDTLFNDLTYFTITRGGINYSVVIDFSIFCGKNYMRVKVSPVSLSNNYYDVVIDPGHGGIDSGACSDSVCESTYNLDFSIKLKKKLEDIGLKVVLTRDNDSYISAYGVNGRTNLPYVVGAKYYISIHLNSSDYSDAGGVEIYAPNNSRLDFASSLAKNIVKYANTDYSFNESFRVSRGVYVRTFTSDDIKLSVDEAKSNNYKPYPITSDTNYYFMIRETGGFMTGAYIDGRDKRIPKNDFYNSNIGSEGYLIELGYLNNSNDLDNLINNSDSYIDGIVNAFKEKLKQD